MQAHPNSSRSRGDLAVADGEDSIRLGSQDLTVGGHQNSGAIVGPPPQRRYDGCLGLAIDFSCRLVTDDDRGVGGQGDAQSGTCRLATGKLGGPGACTVGEPYLLKQGIRFATRVRKPVLQADIVADCETIARCSSSSSGAISAFVCAEL